MRLWSIHPKFLDAKGLVALWRESLLALAVLRGETKGYKNHPQLDRFRETQKPVAAVSKYLLEVLAKSKRRSYNFNETKIPNVRADIRIPVPAGQIAFEWSHLMSKLQVRDPERYNMYCELTNPEIHPLFVQIQGETAPWEKGVRSGH